MVLITIDTLRADHVNAYGYPRETTPFIDSLARKGVLFENAFSASSYTSPSHASIFTGLFPAQHGVRTNGATLRHGYHIVKYFEDLGFEVAGFPAVRFLEGKIAFPTLGRDFRIPERKGQLGHWYEAADQVLERLLRWLDRRDDFKKVFLWVHFYDVHEWNGKLEVPPELIEKMRASYSDELAEFVQREHNIPLEFHGNPGRLKRVMNEYDHCLNFVDQQIERLYKTLDEKGWNDDALWIITSDHGEGLGNHDYTRHGKFIYNEQLHVPLIFHATNGSLKERRVDALVRTVDIYPSIADLMMAPLDKEIHKSAGTSLLALMEGQDSAAGPEYSFAQRRPAGKKGWRSSWEPGDVASLHNLEEKYIYHSEAAHEYYDLRADRFEMQNIWDPEDADQQKLKDRILEILETDKAEEMEEELEPEEVQELEALGYL